MNCNICHLQSGQIPTHLSSRRGGGTSCRLVRSPPPGQKGIRQLWKWDGSSPPLAFLENKDGTARWPLFSENKNVLPCHYHKLWKWHERMALPSPPTIPFYLGLVFIPLSCFQEHRASQEEESEVLAPFLKEGLCFVFAEEQRGW